MCYFAFLSSSQRALLHEIKLLYLGWLKMQGWKMQDWKMREKTVYVTPCIVYFCSVLQRVLSRFEWAYLWVNNELRWQEQQWNVFLCALESGLQSTTHAVCCTLEAFLCILRRTAGATGSRLPNMPLWHHYGPTSVLTGVMCGVMCCWHIIIIIISVDL